MSSRTRSARGRGVGTVLAAVAVVVATGCSSSTVKECLAPGAAFESFVHSSSTTGYRFEGFRMVAMSDAFVGRWDYAGHEMRYVIAAWPVGFDAQKDGVGEADIATSIATSVGPLRASIRPTRWRWRPPACRGWG